MLVTGGCGDCKLFVGSKYGCKFRVQFPLFFRELVITNPLDRTVDLPSLNKKFRITFSSNPISDGSNQNVNNFLEKKIKFIHRTTSQRSNLHKKRNVVRRSKYANGLLKRYQTTNDFDGFQRSRCKSRPGASNCARQNVRRRRTDVNEIAKSKWCSNTEQRHCRLKPCHFNCRQDCIVTTWSDWSVCSSSCRLINSVRVRRVLVPPTHDGVQCPSLSQIIPCRNCSTFYVYKLGPWKPCTEYTVWHSNPTTRLIGHQDREITCLNNKGIQTRLRHVYEYCYFVEYLNISTWFTRLYNIVWMKDQWIRIFNIE